MADLFLSAVAQDRSLAPSNPDRSHQRTLSRSPHPYHRLGTSLVATQSEGLGRRHGRGQGDGDGPQLPRNQRRDQRTSSSESGTEADDERGRFLKGLPAPLLRPHKGLRDTPFEDSTAQPSPSDTPPAVGHGERQQLSQLWAKDNAWNLWEEPERQTIREKYTRRKRTEVVRRIIEILLFFTIGLVVSYEGSSVYWLRASESGRLAPSWLVWALTFSTSNPLSIRCTPLSLPTLSYPHSIQVMASRL
jgi:hypothetical protein